jgi:zinc transporter ZupT
MASVYPLLLAVLGVAVLGVLVGIRLAGIHRLSQVLAPFSGGVLLGVAGFWILPEIAEYLGWAMALAGLAGGFGLVWVIDRHVHAICPACSHTHVHEDCVNQLHGFAAPLLIASGVHSFFDGWGLAVAQTQGFEGLRTAFLLGVSIHKLPEAMAMGVLLLAATGKRMQTALGAIAAQSMLLVGGTVALMVAGQIGFTWSAMLLAAAAGTFAYLGYHAVEGGYRQRGMALTFVPAVTGAVGAAALKSFLPGG